MGTGYVTLEAEQIRHRAGRAGTSMMIGSMKDKVTRSRGVRPFLAGTVLGLLTTFCLALPGDTQANDPIVVLQTTKGPIAIRVYIGMVPNTSRNFLDLVSRGFYNGLGFHRVETWCVQGGDPRGNGTGNFVDPQTGRPRYLNLEINGNLHHNGPGVVAMARSDNPNSASCQFYITKSAVGFLDGKYAIFGGVIDGMRSVFNIRPGDRIMSAQIVGQGGGGGGGSRPAAAQRPTSSGAGGDSGF